MTGRSRVAYENRAIFARTVGATGAYLARMRPLAAWLRFWLAHTAAAWTALRNRATRTGSTSLRAMKTVRRHTLEQVASNGRARIRAPRRSATVANGSGSHAA